MDIQAQTRILLIAGRALMQKSQAMHTMISELQSKVDAIETEMYAIFSGLDDELRNVVFQLNSIPSNTTQEVDSPGDSLQDIISDYFFDDEAIEEEFFEKFYAELSAIKNNLE